MATYNGDNLTEIFHAGTFGNHAMHHANHNWAGQVANDVVLAAKVPAGTKITDMKLIFGAMTATATLDVGYAAVDPGSSLVADPDYFTAGIADTAPTVATNAGSVEFAFVPYEVTEDIYITITIATEDGADVDTDLLIGSVFVGNM
jgi:hypothetical protein